MASRSRWRRAARYTGVAAVAHLGWEMAQLPLYTLWREGTPWQIAFAVVHCSFGDVLITTAALTLAGILAWLRGWRFFGRRMAVTMVVLGIAYTVFSEWLNVTVRGSWAYAPQMPLLPPFGTGLTPLFQWFIVPVLALILTRDHQRPIR